MKKRFFALLLCIIMVFALAACGGGNGNNTNTNNNTAGSSTDNSGSTTQADSSSPTQGNTGGDNSNTSSSPIRDTLTIAISADPGSMDPAYVSGEILTATQCIMEGMWDQAFTGELIMLLATNIDYVAPDHWLIDLREGVKFNNGNPFTASDVLFSLQIYRNSGTNATKAQEIDLEKTVAIGDYQVDLYWENYRTNQWGILGDMWVFDEESYDPERASSDPIGTGPYKLAESVVNSHYKLERRDDYWGDPPQMKYLNFRVMAETSQVVNALETGNIDVGRIAISDIEYVSKLPNLYVKDRYEGNWLTLGFNIQEPSFFNHNTEARYAVCHAINTKVIMDLVYLGQATRMHSAITSTCLDYEPRFDDLHETYAVGYDLDLAKKYADSSGLTGQNIVVITNGTEAHVAVAELIQYMLKEIGVNVSINNYDLAGYNAALKDYTSFDINIAAAINPGNRVAGTLANGIRFYPDMQIPGLWDQQEEMMGLMMNLFYEVDDQKRSDYNFEMFRLYAESCYRYSLCDIKNSYAFASDLDYESMIYRLHGNTRYGFTTSS